MAAEASMVSNCMIGIQPVIEKPEGRCFLDTQVGGHNHDQSLYIGHNAGGHSLVSSAWAEDKANAWYPRTEKVGPDEMFVVALGTGMPTPITRGQKSTAWYVELGNGDIFLFDVGSGSSENLFAMRPDFHRVDKIFASHLHTDHVGDAAVVWVAGWLSGRYTPLHIYGPSGAKPELGTAAFVKGL
jgi:hypothetical protein